MSFHLYDIDEVFSNADGTVQYIELSVGADNLESFWAGHQITVTSGGQTHTFTFPTDLPSQQTANTHVLIATQGFADLGLVTPNYIVQAGFLFSSNATVNFAGVDSVSYTSLPTDGSHSLSFTAGGNQTAGRTGTVDDSSPTNFAGATAHVSLSGAAPITGTDGNDNLVGTAGNDTMQALAGNDTIAGAGGNDTIDGGAGTDVVLVQAADAALSAVSASHVTAPGVNLTLTGVERLSLTDKLVVFDTQPGDAAWQAMALLTAGFGNPSAAIGQLTPWLEIAPAPTMAQQAQVMLDHYAPGIATASLVAYLYGTIAGISPSQAQVDEFANQVGAGKSFADNGALLAFAANLSLNTDKLAGFVGSVQHLPHEFF
jgi:Ca2+-binding RTX toxin-like protein